MSKPHGFRGYIASRAINGNMMPQRVQNLVVRDYANNKGIELKLSAVEYIMPGSYMILENVLDELPKLEGIIMYSLFMLPKDKKRRHAIYERILRHNGVLHAALEGYAIRGWDDVALIEDILDVSALVNPEKQ